MAAVECGRKLDARESTAGFGEYGRHPVIPERLTHAEKRVGERRRAGAVEKERVEAVRVGPGALRIAVVVVADERAEAAAGQPPDPLQFPRRHPKLDIRVDEENRLAARPRPVDERDDRHEMPAEAIGSGLPHRDEAHVIPRGAPTTLPPTADP